jgi:16S rRNA (guanine527-N7)-methyltransferase
LEADRSRLLEYGELLFEASRRTALIGRDDKGRLLMRHVRECISPEFLNLVEGRKRVLDVGSGGGLPGIPMAIVRGDLELTLSERRERKSAFLERAVLRLGMRNTKVMTASVEEIAREYPDKEWDVVVSRAVRWSRGMTRALEHVLGPGGRVIRFGSRHLEMRGVEVIPLKGEEERAVRDWPRETWEDLTNAV